MPEQQLRKAGINLDIRYSASEYIATEERQFGNKYLKRNKEAQWLILLKAIWSSRSFQIQTTISSSEFVTLTETVRACDPEGSVICKIGPARAAGAEPTSAKGKNSADVVACK